MDYRFLRPRLVDCEFGDRYRLIVFIQKRWRYRPWHSDDRLCRLRYRRIDRRPRLYRTTKSL